MTKSRGEGKEETMPTVNLSAGGSDGGGKCPICSRRLRLRLRKGTSKLCGRCSHRSRTDMMSFLVRRSSLTHCPGCSSYLQPPRKWVRADPNSNKLLSLCVRLLCGPLPRPLRIINPKFIESSDPDMVKINVHFRGEIAPGAISDRHHVAEFTVCHKICESCSSSSDPQRGVTRVDLRQRHPQRRFTLFHIEKVISEHGAAQRAVRIQEHDQGTEFMFSERSHALDLIQLIEGVIPVKKRSDDRAGSFSLHILPIRQDDLVRLPAAVSDSLLGGGGNLGPLVICTEVSARGISLIDPCTMQAALLSAEDYWRAPFRATCFSHSMVEYLVLDIVVITPEPPPPPKDNPYCLAHAHITRVSDLGKKDGQNKLVVRTHLGRLLKPGDYVFGYDVGGAAAAADGPTTEVILVKKGYTGAMESEWKRRRGEPSARKLRSTGTGLDGVRNDEYEELLRVLEGNARLGLIEASPPPMSKEGCQMLPTSTSSSDDVPSTPAGEAPGDKDAADHTIMDWLPSTQLGSPSTRSATN